MKKFFAMSLAAVLSLSLLAVPGKSRTERLLVVKLERLLLPDLPAIMWEDLPAGSPRRR